MTEEEVLDKIIPLKIGDFIKITYDGFGSERDYIVASVVQFSHFGNYGLHTIIAVCMDGGLSVNYDIGFSPKDIKSITKPSLNDMLEVKMLLKKHKLTYNKHKQQLFKNEENIPFTESYYYCCY